jgi:hypothetical protein
MARSDAHPVRAACCALLIAAAAPLPSAALLSTALLSSCSGRANGDPTMQQGAGAQAAQWQAVDDASAAEQPQRLEAFLAAQTQAGAPPLQVTVRDKASGAAAKIDKALWAAPSNYEVTLRYGQDTYVFVPKSGESLKPLFRE